MARRTPRVLRLLTQRVTVEVVDGLHGEVEDDPEHSHALYGAFQPRDLLILLDRNQVPDRMRETLAHEILHALLNAAHLEFDDDERVVTGLSPVLLSFLRENPGAIAYLQEKT